MGQAACLDFSDDILSWRKVENPGRKMLWKTLWKKSFTAAAARVNQSSAFFIYASWESGPEAWEESPFPKWSGILSSAAFFFFFFFHPGCRHTLFSALITQ